VNIEVGDKVQSLITDGYAIVTYIDGEKVWGWWCDDEACTQQRWDDQAFNPVHQLVVIEKGRCMMEEGT